jgi:DNA-binding SARP family transcriptional activator/tetratricopeptide (TPR) repeat protein
MEFRILGPLEVSRENAIINIGGPRQQTVMAVLLLEANHVVPVDRLIRAVWDEEPPTTARGQVQICISALRRQIWTTENQQVIRSRPPGYLLEVDDAALDADVFESGVAAARSARMAGEMPRAAAGFRGALALWRGEALSGLTSRLVQQSVTQLNERRLGVLEERLECDLLLGLHQDLVGELVWLVEEHPLRERLRALLMTALYRAGRQAEALDAYRRARGTLMDELGVEPGDELRRLHHAILNGDPVPEPVPEPARAPAVLTRGGQAPVPRLLPTAIPDFTGRRRLVDSLVAKAAEAGMASSIRQAVGIIVIVGRGGAGKTTLAVQAAHRLAGTFPDGQLFARLRFGDQPVNPADLLERFLRALGVGGPVPEGTEERAEMYRSLLGERRMLIVLDDAMSEQQVSALLPGSSQCSVIVTSRKRLTGLSAAQRVEVGGFSHRSAVVLLTRIVGSARIEAEPDAVTALCELCAYLPLALRIVAARLAARPHWGVTDLVERLEDESRRLDELSHGELGVRASISLTYDTLSVDAQRLFRRLALLEAPSFASWVAAPLLETEMLHAQDVLEELAEAYLLDTEPGGATGLTRYRFHDIMRPFARERLAADEDQTDRHKALERLLGALLNLVGAAHRREYSGDFLMLRSGASRWPLPDSLVRRVLTSPLAWYEDERLSIVAAVRQAAASGLTEHSWELALSTVALFESRAYFGDWRETHETALKAVCRAGDRWGEAAMRYSLGSLDMFERHHDQADRQLSRSLALHQQLGDRYGAALVLRNLAYLDRMNGNLERALARWDEALGTFQVMGDRIAEAHVLHNLAQVRLDFGEDELARELLDRAMAICDDLGNRRVGAQVLHRLGELYARRGQLDQAASAYRKVLSSVRESADRVGECYALLGLAAVSLESGRAADATRTLDDAQNLADAIGEQMLQARVALARARAALGSGVLAEAAEHAGRAEHGFAKLKASMLCAEALFVRGQVCLEAGETEAAVVAWQSSAALLSTLDPRITASLAAELERHLSAARGRTASG